jgi:Flp pilus assembly protein TadD
MRRDSEEGSHSRAAMFGSLLFAVHPIHVEAVTWLAARKEVLQGFFFFLAFYLYMKGKEAEKGGRLIFLGFVLFSILLATLSKPSSVVFPGIIMIYEITIGKENIFNHLKKHWIFWSLSLIISAIFILILMKVMIEAGGIKPFRGDSFLSNALIPLYAFLYSIKLLVATINYSAAYSLRISLPAFGFKNVVLIIVTILLFLISIVSLRKTKVIFFSFFFFLVTLLPYLNIIPISTLLADRYVFIASFAFAFLMGVLFDRFYDYQHKRFSKGFFKLLSVSLFLVLLLGYSFMTIRQNTIWENSYTLWADAVEKHPNSNTANALMGVVYMEAGMDQEALKYLEKAVELLPSDYQSRNNLGIIYGRIGQPEKALKELETAIWLKPEEDTIKINLSVYYLRKNEFQKAEEILKYLINKNYNNSASLRFRLAMVYKEAGRFESALAELNKSSELAPHIINPYEEIGNIYSSRIKDMGKAIFYYSKAIEAAKKVEPKAEELRWMVQDLER